MSYPTKNPPTQRGEKLTDVRKRYLELNHLYLSKYYGKTI